MGSNNSLENLGGLSSSYDKIIKKYKVEDKSEDILSVIFSIIKENKKEDELRGLLSSMLNLDLIVLVNLTLDLKREILSKKDKINSLKESLIKKDEFDFSPQAIGEEFLSKIDLRITDEAINKRYSDAISSWLKDVRKDADLKEVLTRSTKIGGVGMDENIYNKLSELLVQKKQQITEEKINMPQIVSAYEAKQGGSNDVIESEIDVQAKVRRPIIQTQDTQDVHIDQLLQNKGIGYGELAAKEKIKKELGNTARVPKVSNDFAKEIIAEEEFLQSQPEIAPISAKPAAQLLQQKKIEPTLPPQQVKQPMIRRVDTQNRPKMEDVRMEARTKLYGPIEELGALSIMDFRRLSKDPSEAALKIVGKLDLLEDESLIKKMQGIKALRSSPLYKTYAEIMNQAMMTGQSIEAAVNEKNVITLPEFKAIMELNKNIKY